MSMDGMNRWWGPVFDAERVTRARRWQGYAMRSAFVLGLLLALILGCSSIRSDGGVVTVQELAAVGSSASNILTFLELTAVLLVAPAATAGAICLDKSRGSLAHVFVTDLSNREIVLGKLAARLMPVWSLLACALPVSAAATWMGGIDPMAIAGTFLIVAGLAVLGCSMALMLSVWASKPQEVISVVFGVWTLWLLAALVSQIYYLSNRAPFWLERTNPFYLANAPYDHPGETSLLEPFLFALGCVVIGAVFAAVAVAKVRVVGCRSDRVRARRVGPIGRMLAWARSEVRWGRGPKLDANPVLWREWHRARPSRWSRFVWIGFGALNALSSLGLIATYWTGKSLFLDSELSGGTIGLLASLGLLLVSTSTASVLSEERSRGSLDVLISTPVSTRSILVGKWRGAFRMVPRLVFWPLVLGVMAATLLDGRLRFVELAILYLIPVAILVQGAALVSLGLALATWIKRTGQATAWTIAILLASVIGWIILAEFFLLNYREFDSVNGQIIQISRDPFRETILDYVLMMGSPLVNVALPIMTVMDGVGESTEVAWGMLILLAGWTTFYGLMALVLFEATVRTFDRCLGRVSERATKPRLEPSKAPRRFEFKAWGWRIPTPRGRSVARAGGLD